jgi:hypothetical protein
VEQHLTLDRRAYGARLNGHRASVAGAYLACLRTLLMLVLALAGAACSRQPSAGRIHFYLTADVRAAGRVDVLQVSITEVGVHPVGQAIETGWLGWPPDQHDVDLTTVTAGSPLSLGMASAPAGRYDRVRIVAEGGSTRLQNGDSVPLTLTVEPIAAPFQLRPYSEVNVRIELIAWPQTGGGYELFTKSAVVTPAIQGR